VSRRANTFKPCGDWNRVSRAVLPLLLLVALVLAADGAVAQCRENPDGSINCDWGGGGGSGGGDGFSWTGNTAQTIYGILGLFVMLPGALYTYHKVRTRRKTLAQYLQDVEATYARSKQAPARGLDQLAHTRAEVRYRYEKGRLEDAQFLELDRRIGEYIGRLRMREIELRFPNLPSALWPEIKHVVQDGQLTHEEVSHIERRAKALRMAPEESQELAQALRRWILQTPAELTPPPPAGP
jgi:hypothetical protein